MFDRFFSNDETLLVENCELEIETLVVGNCQMERGTKLETTMKQRLDVMCDTEKCM